MSDYSRAYAKSCAEKIFRKKIGLTLNERVDLVAEEALPLFSRVRRRAPPRHPRVPHFDALLKVPDDGALSAVEVSAVAREGFVVEEPARVDDAADLHVGGGDHVGHHVHVDEDAGAARAPARQVQLVVEEELLIISELPQDLGSKNQLLLHISMTFISHGTHGGKNQYQ